MEEKLAKLKQILIKNFVNYPVCSGSTPEAHGEAYTEKKDGITFIRIVNLVNA